MSGFCDSAMAIITRWRMPPESSCGYCLSRRCRLGDLHDVEQAARASACAALADSERWAAIASVSCLPMDRTGLSEVIGSWKIMPMSLPRTAQHLGLAEAEEVAALEQRLAGGRCAPSARAAGRMIDSAVIDLPEPLSPAMHSVSPRSRSKEMWSTTTRAPCGVATEVARSRTESSG